MKLKPCPFCGEDMSVFCYSAAQIGMLDEDDPNYDNAVFEFAVCCDFHLGGCGATSGYRDTAEEAVEAWNRRATEKPQEEHPILMMHDGIVEDAVEGIANRVMKLCEEVDGDA